MIAKNSMLSIVIIIGNINLARLIVRGQHMQHWLGMEFNSFGGIK